MTLESPSEVREKFHRATVWGGVNGVLFWLALLAFVAVASIVSIIANPGSAVGFAFFLAIVSIIGSAIAFVVGAVFGLLFAILDGVLLEISRYIVLFARRTSS